MKKLARARRWRTLEDSSIRVASFLTCLALASLAVVGLAPPADSSQDVIAQPDISLLTPEETARIERASILAHENWDVITSLAALDGFGGLHLDGSAGLVVSVQSEYLARAAEIAADLGAPEIVDVRIVEASARALWDAAETVMAEAPSLLPEGTELTASSVTYRDNRLGLHVLGDPLAAEEVLRELIDVPYLIEPALQGGVLTPPPVVGDTYVRILGNEVCTDRGNCTPLRSGLRLLHEYGAAQVLRCTSAFAARDRNGRYGLLSAAHCSQGSGPFTHGPFVIGPMTNEVYGNVTIDGEKRWVDAGFIPNENASIGTTPRVYISDATQGRFIESVYREAMENGLLVEAPVEGDAICLSGDTTGNSCGEVGPRINFGNPVVKWRVPCATTVSQGGDSGAGVYRGKRAMGVHFGHITAGGAGVCGVGSTVFTPIGRVESALRVTVSTR